MISGSMSANLQRISGIKDKIGYQQSTKDLSHLSVPVD